MNNKLSSVSRRAFLERSAVLAAVPFLKPLSSLIEDSPGAPVFSVEGPIRYGLFFGKGELQGIRERYSSLEMYEELRNELSSFDREAEREFLRNDVQYNDHLIDLNRMGHAAPKMAFVYLVTGDEDAADLAIELIDTIMKFPTWDYFLEDNTHIIGLQRAPSSVVAVSLVSDWLGEYVDDAKRRSWIQTMGSKGNEACFLSTFGMRYPEKVKGWTMDLTSGYFDHRPDQLFDLSNWPYILDRTNLKAVPASALAIGAAAYEAEMGRSDDTDRWFEQASYSISSFGEIYAEDGSYDENLSYANYTSEHLAQGMEILRRFREEDLTDKINWPGFVEFMYGMSLPTTEDPFGIANFGDAGNGMMSSVPFWIANTFKDPRSAWFGNNLSRAHNIWSVFWHNESDGAAPDTGPTMYRSDLDWITARTGYDPDDLVVAMRSGPPANHEHADRNSIIVKCFGEILIADPYRPPYANTDPSWPLRLTIGHSAALVDGQGHQYHDGKEGTNPSDAFAKIIRTAQYGDLITWSSDASDAYRLVNNDIDSVIRTIVILVPTRTVVVVDNVTKSVVPSAVTARFYCRNIDGNGTAIPARDQFLIRRPGARLRGHAFASGGVTMSAGRLDIPRERAVQHPFIDVTARVKSQNQHLVTVLQPENNEFQHAVEMSNKDNVTTIGVGGYTLRIINAGRIPEAELV